MPPRARSPAAAQGVHLGVRAAGVLVPALAGDARPSASRITHPTTGLGLVVPSPRADSATARRIALDATLSTVPPLRLTYGSGEVGDEGTPTGRLLMPTARYLSSGL